MGVFVAVVSKNHATKPWAPETGTTFHSLSGTQYSLNVCWMQKHKRLSDQMILSLNFRVVWWGVLPTVACRSVFHNCQFEANQITKCSLATCRAFDTGSSLMNRFHPWGICSFPWERNLFLAEVTGAWFSTHPQVSSFGNVSESPRHFSIPYIQWTLPTMYSLTLLASSTHRPDTVFGARETDEEDLRIRETTALEEHLGSSEIGLAAQ